MKKRRRYQLGTRHLLYVVAGAAVVLMFWTRFRDNKALVRDLESHGALVNSHSILMPSAIVKLTAVTQVDFSHQPIQDDELCEVARLLENADGLTHLILSHTLITDDGVRCLYGLEQLSYISLTGTDVTEDGMRQLRANLQPSCWILH